MDSTFIIIRVQWGLSSPPLKTQVKTPIPPLSNPSLYSKIGFVMGWMTEISGLSPPPLSKARSRQLSPLSQTQACTRMIPVSSGKVLTSSGR